MEFKLVSNSSHITSTMLYGYLSLVELAKRIAEDHDRRALEEFLNHRTVFRVKNGPLLRFTEFLDVLWKIAVKMAWRSRNPFEVADKACDLTTDKFARLPNFVISVPKNCGGGVEKVKYNGSDCSLYFNALQKLIVKSFDAEPPENQIEAEIRTARAMQGLVCRHFSYSVLEAMRSVDRFWSRYNWNLNGQTICVYLPVYLEGKNRKTWLEKNIENPDFSRAGERQRIQEIINLKLPKEFIVPIDEGVITSNGEGTSLWEEPGEGFGLSLAKAVAKEKTSNIHLQRRSIRALGKKKLKKMIVQIFEDISCDKYRDVEIGKNAGLTKASYSRFAGSRWQDTDSSVPDLWRNTAQVLKSQAVFREVAESAGYLDKVVATMERVASPKKGQNHD